MFVDGLVVVGDEDFSSWCLLAMERSQAGDGYLPSLGVCTSVVVFGGGIVVLECLSVVAEKDRLEMRRNTVVLWEFERLSHKVESCRA